MEEVPYLQKTHSKGLGYSFASEAELIQKLRPAMVRHGITLRPDAMQRIESGEYTTSNGKTMRFVVILVDYVFSFGNEVEHVQVFGEAADTSDKAMPKAMTLALKYALRQFFLIETGDDPDHVAAERGSYQPSAAVATAARAIAKEGRHTWLDVMVEKVGKKFEGEDRSYLLRQIERQRSGLPPRKQTPQAPPKGK